MSRSRDMSRDWEEPDILWLEPNCIVMEYITETVCHSQGYGVLEEYGHKQNECLEKLIRTKHFLGSINFISYLNFFLQKV